jgi:integrase
VRKVEKERSIDQCSKTLSLVMMVQGLPKTEASAKDVPLDAALAELLLKLKLSSPYNNVKDWVFASPRRKGKQPYWPDALWKRYGRDAVKMLE